MTRQANAPTHPGASIKERREAAGLSLEGLAYKANVSLRTVERIEAEQSTPQRSTLTVINAALDEFASEPVPEEKAA